VSTLPYPHGTVSGYTNRKCRCADCRLAWRQYMENWKTTAPPLPVGDSRHGSINGYQSYRCRCAWCTAAWRNYQRAYRERTS